MSTHARYHTGRAGVTVVEVMIVVTLIGLTTAMGFPRIATAMRHGRVNQAAAVLATDLESAVSLAARQRRPVRITYASTAGEIRISDRNTGTILRRRSLGSESEWKLTSVSLSAGAVDLFPSGAASSALTVQLGSGGYTRRVTMTRAGLVRVTQ